MNALMKCVIVFPHRTLTIYLTLGPGASELLKTTSYQMNPQFRLSNFKFKFITERHSCEKKIQASEGFGAQLQYHKE